MDIYKFYIYKFFFLFIYPSLEKIENINILKNHYIYKINTL